MGDGTEKNPYTRRDVLRLIKKNGGKAEGLLAFQAKRYYFRRKVKGIVISYPKFKGVFFEDGIDLHGLNLQHIILHHAHLEGANLKNANLEGAYLSNAHLERANLWSANLDWAQLEEAHLEEADLMFANLEGAFLVSANLEKANLKYANLKEACLYNACLEGAYLDSAHLEGTDLSSAKLTRADLRDVKFPRDTNLEGAEWGNFILGAERAGEGKEKYKGYRGHTLGAAEATYRNLKIWYTEHGFYDIAGKFFYREMEARRKAQSWKKEPHLKLWSWILRILCGYGEKPERVIISAAAIVFGLAAAYCLWGSFDSSSFGDTLYYSVASFTALGYGQWAPQPEGWAKGVGAAEAVLGVSMLALFLVTFTRKMIR